MLGPWIKLTIDTTLLGLEAQSVIGLRWRRSLWVRAPQPKRI